MNSNSLSVVIPTYNGKNLLEQNLPSVLNALNKLNDDWEVIVCDDASSDDTIEFLEKNYPSIRLVVSETNKGFGENVNQGILLSKKKYILLLNNDVQIPEESNAIQLLLEKIKTDNNIFGVGGVEYNPSAKTLRHEYGTNGGISFGKISLRENKINTGNTVNIGGGFSIVDTSKIQKLGGFNELFSPFYYEDLDICLQALKLGWKCCNLSNAIVIHPESMTIPKQVKNNLIKTVIKKNINVLNLLHLPKLYSSIFLIRVYIKYFILSAILLLFKSPKIIIYKNSLKNTLKLLPQIRAKKIEFAERVKNNGVKPIYLTEVFKTQV